MNKTIRILETYVAQMIIANQKEHDSNRADFITEVNEHIAELKENEVNFVSSNVPVSGCVLIRIKKSQHKEYWYADKIGETFEVVQHPISVYHFRCCDDNSKCIDKEDAEVLKHFR